MKTKLIATDLDGTLLTSKNKIPDSFEGVANSLLDKGYTIVIASGRQYYNITKLFSNDLGKRLWFSAENGAIVYKGNQPIYSSSISLDKINSVLSFLKDYDYALPVLCGEKSAYSPPISQEIYDFVKLFYEKIYVSEDAYVKSESDNVCKIAVRCDSERKSGLLEKLSIFNDYFDIAVSGPCWIDMMKKNTNKGSSISFIQENLQITPDETMVFGDYDNDLSMFRVATESYAMGNAVPVLKEVAKYQAMSNDEHGVIKVLESLSVAD